MSDPAFALVLINANDCEFRHDLVEGSIAGGLTAVALLKKTVQEYLADLLPSSDGIPVMARVYGEFTSLAEKHPEVDLKLYHFALGFSHEEPLMDMINVGYVDTLASKVAANLSMFMNNENCKQIILGASENQALIDALAAHEGAESKVTLVVGGTVPEELKKFDLNAVQFPKIFRTEGVTDDAPKMVVVSRSSLALPNTQTEVAVNGPSKPHWTSFTEKRTWSAVTRKLPEEEIPDHIPLNKDDKRLDIAMGPPTTKVWVLYNAACENKKPCIRYHLNAACGPYCLFDHNPVKEEVKYAMRFKEISKPCSWGGDCRRAGCLRGHICQSNKCKGPYSCLMGLKLHGVDMDVVKWVEPFMRPGVNAHGGSESPRPAEPAVNETAEAVIKE